MRLNLQEYYNLFFCWCVNITRLFFKGSEEIPCTPMQCCSEAQCLHVMANEGGTESNTTSLACQRLAVCPWSRLGALIGAGRFCNKSTFFPKRPICLVGLTSLFKEVYIYRELPHLTVFCHKASATTVDTFNPMHRWKYNWECMRISTHKDIFRNKQN